VERFGRIAKYETNVGPESCSQVERCVIAGVQNVPKCPTLHAQATKLHALRTTLLPVHVLKSNHIATVPPHLNWLKRRLLRRQFRSLHSTNDSYGPNTNNRTSHDVENRLPKVQMYIGRPVPVRRECKGNLGCRDGDIGG
jgi:hypothetical protein